MMFRKTTSPLQKGNPYYAEGILCSFFELVKGYGRVCQRKMIMSYLRKVEMSY